MAVAVSGGVDSLAAAFLLKSGYTDIFGIHFITGYEKPEIVTSPQQAIAHISRQLGIPVKTVDLKNHFQQLVVDYFTKTYGEGKTPNPCMVCNAAIKFGVLMDTARKLGADKLATGHYAGVTVDESGAGRLFRGADPVKDQSYFLAMLTSAQLAGAAFPLSGMTKSEVKALAAANNLTPVVTDESQDICFIRGTGYARFLEKQPGFSLAPGHIVDIDGNQLGHHNGLHHFTVGQRRGINIPAARPYYVIRLVPATNTLVVGEKSDLTVSQCRVSSINWLTGLPAEKQTVLVQVRYRHQAVPAFLIPEGADSCLLEFHQPQQAVTPGQGAVFYKDSEVLGGGWIDG